MPTSPKQTTTTPTLPPPTPSETLRYRHHHAVNLGSIFVLERWLAPHMFPPSHNTTGQSELSAVQAWITQEGIAATTARFQHHWNNYITDADLDWLADEGSCTTVCLPVGFFTLGPEFCTGTPFAEVKEVYRHAWSAVLSLVRRCRAHGMGVVIDFHALPGGANTGFHSGMDDIEHAGFWSSMAYRDQTAKCLCFVAEQVKGVENVVGIGVVNEPQSEGRSAQGWYEEILPLLAGIDGTMPIYIADTDDGDILDWSRRWNTIQALRSNPVVVDVHCYACFPDTPWKRHLDLEKSLTTPPQQPMWQTRGVQTGAIVDYGAAEVVVGEYSCALDEDTMARFGGNDDDSRKRLACQYGRMQREHFQRTARGSFFWTYIPFAPGAAITSISASAPSAAEHTIPVGSEWSFRHMTLSGAISPPAWMSYSSQKVQRSLRIANMQREDRLERARVQHCQYWTHAGACAGLDHSLGENGEHWRYVWGWETGFADGIAFWEIRTMNGIKGGGADRLGMVELWCLKRLRESGLGAEGKGDKDGSLAWEFEHGFRRGLADFSEAVGV